MKSNLFSLFLLSLIFLPHLVWGADFTPLVSVPGLSGDPATAGGGFSSYINALYRLSISVAALIAVVKIIFAGVKYMFTDIVPGKEEAKKDIRSALLGLLVVISAVLILSTVNSDLTNFKILLEPVELPEPPPPPAVTDAKNIDEFIKIAESQNKAYTLQTCGGLIESNVNVKSLLVGNDTGVVCNNDPSIPESNACNQLCKTTCDVLEGVDESRNMDIGIGDAYNIVDCVYLNENLLSALNTKLQTIADENCENEKGCVAMVCNDYGSLGLDDYDDSYGPSCVSDCESRDGKYIEDITETEICVFPKQGITLNIIEGEEYTTIYGTWRIVDFIKVDNFGVVTVKMENIDNPALKDETEVNCDQIEPSVCVTEN